MNDDTLPPTSGLTHGEDSLPLIDPLFQALAKGELSVEEAMFNTLRISQLTTDQVWMSIKLCKGDDIPFSCPPDDLEERKRLATCLNQAMSASRLEMSAINHLKTRLGLHED